jgi:2-C-methyl-D-erythritol 4-phosphate cytidylyltransferase
MNQQSGKDNPKKVASQQQSPHGRERVAAVVVAAGPSVRMSGVEKLFADIDGVPLLARTLAAFEACPAVNEVVVVANEENLTRARQLIEERGLRKVTRLCLGGVRRQDSVWEGLQQLAGCDWVVIHDGTRPFVTAEMITQGLAEAREHGAAIAAVPLRDTVKMVNPDRLVRSTPNRSDMWIIQTPVVFRFALIVTAYRQAFGEVSDDAMLLERQGQPVRVYQGSYDNLKITTPEDLELAQAIARRCKATEKQ